jgi:predicted PurR-regulated permease PerM
MALACVSRAHKSTKDAFMALSVRTQAKYWGISALLASVLLWYLGDVLLPFVLGAAIAYFLDPVADRLEAMGCSRVLATLIITVVMLVVFILAALLLIPTLLSQAAQLFAVAPSAFRTLFEFLNTNFPMLLEEDGVMRQSLVALGETIRARGPELLNSVLNSALGILNIVTILLIAPVVAVYLLLDWDRMIARLDALMPRDHAATIRSLMRAVDATLAGFIRGMGTVCLILGTFYALSLYVLGLQFGLVVGVVAGLLTFIPYVGAIVGGGLAIGLALFQYWNGVEVLNEAGTVIGARPDWIKIALVYVVFQSGQLIEGNVLTPRLVGNSVGLHPVWLLLALSVFGAIFGFIGLLVAVPLAASIGVVIRFGIGQYLDSKLYIGLSKDKME